MWGYTKTMKLFTQRKILAVYLVFVLWALLIILLRFWPASPFLISITFLLLVFSPGFSLARLFRIKFEKDRVGQLVFYLVLGLIFNLFLAFIIILVGQLAITGALIFYFIGLILIFIISLIFEFIRPVEEAEPWNFHEIFRTSNLIYLALFFFILLVLATVDQLGTNFIGDPTAHLWILRKTIEGQPISIGNLTNVKNQFHIILIVPAWHVFLAICSKITGANIFILFREITTPLVLFVFLAWYWLFLKLLPSRHLAVLALFLFGLYHFGPNGYIFTRLAVPDTFCGLILFPLSFALALKYIFDQKSRLEHLIVLSILVTFMGLIHWTQYFYYVSALGLLAILYLLYCFLGRLAKFDWPILRKILLATFGNLILVAPLIIFEQLRGQAVTRNLGFFPTVTKGSNNDRFYKFTPYFQLSYVLLPLLGLFLRKYRRFIFIFSIFLVGPLVYNFPGLYGLCRRFLSHVFVNRLYTNLGEWPYLIWAIILGFVLVLIDRLLAKLTKISIYLRYLIDLGLFLAFAWLIYLQSRFERLAPFYQKIFSNETKFWLNNNYHWLIPAVILVVLLLVIWQQYSAKFLAFFEFSDSFHDQWAVLILTLLLVFFISIPSQGYFQTYFSREIQSGRFFAKAADPTYLIIDVRKFGGMKTIDFIKKHIPAKSIFDSSDANFVLPTMADVYLGAYTFDSDPTKKYAKIYDPNTSEVERLRLIADGQIEYILYVYHGNHPASPGQTAFDQNRQDFQKIYSNGEAAIYKVK